MCCCQKSELLSIVSSELGLKAPKFSNLYVTEKNLWVVVDVITMKVFRDSQQQIHFRNREEIGKLYHFSRFNLAGERKKISISLVRHARLSMSTSAFSYSMSIFFPHPIVL
jgi:hypothetical protein